MFLLNFDSINIGFFPLLKSAESKSDNCDHFRNNIEILFSFSFFFHTGKEDPYIVAVVMIATMGQNVIPCAICPNVHVAK